MRSFGFFVFFIVLVFFNLTAHASSMARDLMSDDDFHQLIPRQGPLTELFTSIVSSPPVSLNRSQKAPVRIAILLFGEADSIENQGLLFSFKQRMRELSIDYRLDIYMNGLGHGEDIAPYLKIEKMPPDYIVVTKMEAVQRRFVERFLYSNETKVILYGFATPLKHWVNHPPLMYIGFDQTQITRQLASYLDRQLAKETEISAFILADNYLGYMRCDVFLDEMVKYGRAVNSIHVIQDSKEQAFESTKALLNEASTDFIFSCSKNISDGVVLALNEMKGSHVQTNGWGLSNGKVMGLTNLNKKVSVMFNKDYLSIAIAEAIKLDLEGKNMPNLYIAPSVLAPSELGSVSLRLMVERAYPYSVMLWQK